ncbi:DUF6287 domain-containing protein [Lactococcus nasutitermitis]|uniref:DUF6287 domain-containing protein n=1 Tax=Lactococcus nasutitermitis TaxID=1652957 RepID=A0ABV9JEM9_9LACT|nr:DUF6287 domain-containing protein [Lactococcus nasutitermitis]
MLKRIIIISSIITAFIIAITIGISWYLFNQPTVAVSGVIKDKAGKVYVDKTVQIAGQNIRTDAYGQFFTHLIPNKKYQITTNELNLSLQADKNGKLVTSNNGSSSLELSTPKNTVQMSIRSGAAYLDQTNNVAYNSNRQTLTFNSIFQFDKGDKVVIPPDSTNPNGLAFKITSLTEQNGKISAKVKTAKIQEVLNSLKIHTGEITGDKLTTTRTQNYALKPTDFQIGDNKTTKLVHAEIPTLQFPKDNDKSYSATIKGSADISGSFQLDVNLDFWNSNNDSIEVQNSLAISQNLTATLKATAKSQIKNKLFTYDTPVPFVSVTINSYMNASAKVTASEATSFSPAVKVSATPQKGISMSYNNAVPQASLAFDGQADGAFGFEIGPNLTAYLADLFTVGAKVGFEGKATVSGKLSTTGDNSFSGSGKLDFVTYLEAGSPFLNLSKEIEVIRNPLFSAEIQSGQADVKAATDAVTAAEKAKSDAEANAQKAAQSQSMNLQQIAQGDFSSILGTWKNNAGESMTITTTLIGNFEPHNTSKNGTSGSFYILPGKFSSNTLLIMFDNYSGAGDGGIWFISKGQTLPISAFQSGSSSDAKSDSSDSTKDRIVIGDGAGSWVYMPSKSAYYKVNSTPQPTISTADQATITSSVQTAQVSINNLTQSWEATTKTSLQARLDKVRG